jgi:hypothetical protein
LLANSPAIDKGASGTLATDGRGAPRPFDDPGIANAGDGADIGAFELQPATFQFSASNYEASESGGAVTITVHRIGNPAGAVSVQYATSNGTATGGGSCGAAGVDYQNASGTLNFAAGATTQTFTITLCDDAAMEVDETVNLTLSAPSGAAPNPAVLTILDNDAPAPSRCRRRFPACRLRNSSG